MELIGIELNDFTRRSRSLLLNHSDLALDRILLQGEKVVLWDSVSEEYHSGTVADVADNDNETHYRFEVGVRLPEELALDRITGTPSTSPSLGTREVFALLHQLRDDSPAPTLVRGTALPR